jgi:hypothetical protein
MGNLSSTIPFTELYERVLTMARIDSPNNEDFAKGIVNDIYTRTLPRMEDWTPITTDSYVTMVPEYTTGTVTISAGSTSITGNSTVWTAAMTVDAGYKIKIAGNDNVYKFEYVSGTSGTLNMPLSGDTDLTQATYVIFKDEYTLAADFDRFLKNGSIYVYSGGRVRDIIKEAAHDVFITDFRPETSDRLKMAIISRTNSSGTRMVRLNPPPKKALVYPYEYIKRLNPMKEYFAGTVDATEASDTVTGTDTAWSGNVSAGDYFRIDGNGIGDSSKWYKIQSVDSNTQITLEDDFVELSETSSSYTISSAPTAFPTEFHEFILYDAVLTVVGEQSDSNIEGFAARRLEISQDLKKNYKSRRTNVQVRVEDDGYR